MNDGKIKNSLYEKITSASIGAFVTSAVVTPLDVVKVRLQSQTNPLVKVYEPTLFFNRPVPYVCPPKAPFLGTFDGIYFILKNEGPSSLWRGLIPTLLMSIPATVVYFVSYEYTRYHPIWQEWGFKDTLKLDFITPLVCGGVARTLSAITISPLELVRTRMQSISHEKQSVPKILKDTYQMMKVDGFLSLWKGLTPTLWRDVPFSAIYWLGYEKIKGLLKYHLNGGASDVLNDWALSFTSGFISGSFAGFLTTPFDVAKTRRQVQGLQSSTSNQGVFTSREKSMSRIMGSIVQEFGWRGLFKGLGARLVKVAPACGIMISSYEVGKDVFKTVY